MFVAIKDFFSGLGNLLGKMFSFLKANVTDEQLHFAIELCKKAALDFADNDARREWVAKELVTEFHISASLANTITELAYQALVNQLS